MTDKERLKSLGIIEEVFFDDDLQETYVLYEYRCGNSWFIASAVDSEAGRKSALSSLKRMIGLDTND